MKKNHSRLPQIIIAATILLTWMLTSTLSAQVRIGGGDAPTLGAILDLNSTDKGGLLFSNVSITSLDSIPANATVFPGIVPGSAAADVNLPLAGMVVYNTNPGTGEGLYLWDGNEWLRINLGGSVAIKPDGPLACDTFPADGYCTNDYQVTDPACKQQGEFVFTWIAGESFIDRLDIVDAGAGKFSVKFLPNDRASQRQAILLVTSPCGNSNTFVFNQKGDETLCNATATAPKIASENGASLCGSGAAYLYLTSDGTTRISGTGYVWTLNGRETARDTAGIIATVQGKYIVYSSAIGCTSPKPDTLVVERGTGGAPIPVAVVAGVNNGLVCSAGGETPLFASASGSGNIVWYKDGAKQTGKNGTKIDAGVGVWFAAVENGSCSSVPSNSITVALDPNSGQDNISPVTFKVNGVLPSGNNITLCTGGSLLLEVQAPHPEAGVTYRWYAGDAQNGVLLGTGATLITTVAAVQNYPILQCTASEASSCTKSQYTQFSIGTVNPPDYPSITNSSGQFLCGGTAYLMAGSPGAASYQWYRDGVLLPETSAALTATATGTYTVYGISGSCMSPVSNDFVITGNSGYGTAAIKEDGTTVSNVAGLTANSNTAKTLTAVINPSGAETYSWTIATTGTFTPSETATPATATGSSVTVNLPSVLTGAATVTATVVATNACTPSATATAVYTVNPLCVEANATAFGYTPASKAAEILPGNSTVLSITPNGDPDNFTYAWYNSSAPGAVAGTGKSFSATAAGTYYCKVKSVCGSLEAQSANFTVTEKDPASITPGAGTLSGRTCFDINATTDDNNLTTAMRANDWPANFTQSDVYRQSYSFQSSSSGTVQNVRYAVVDVDGAVTSHSGSGFTSGNFGNNKTATVSIVYKTNLNTSSSPQISGARRRTNPVQVKVFVIYNNGTQDVQVSLTANIQDGACCGAMVSSNQWKAIMCHNLGATKTSNPYVSQYEGSKYLWNTATPIITESQNGSCEAVSGWPSGHVTNVAWSDTNNPCPAGWRLLKQSDTDALKANNVIGSTEAYTSHVGSTLALRTGKARKLSDGSCYRTSGNISYESVSWVTEWTEPNLGTFRGVILMKLKESRVMLSRDYAVSVRCISQ